jgi:hypothetical protein
MARASIEIRSLARAQSAISVSLMTDEELMAIIQQTPAAVLK